MVEVMYIYTPQRPLAKKKKSHLKQTGTFQITPALRQSRRVFPKIKVLVHDSANTAHQSATAC